MSLEYALHRIGPLITGGVVAHPLGRGVDALRFFRDTCASLPDEATLVCCGPIDDGRAVLRSLKTFGPPVLDLMGTMPYIALTSMLDPAFPTAALRYSEAQFLTDLSDDAIRTLIAGLQQCPSPMSHVRIEHVHGVATRIPVSVIACGDARQRVQRRRRLSVDGSS